MNLDWFKAAGIRAIKTMNLDWFKAAGIRAIKTMAQTAVAGIGTTVVAFSEVNWALVLSTAVTAGILSMLTSISGLPELEK